MEHHQSKIAKYLDKSSICRPFSTYMFLFLWEKKHHVMAMAARHRDGRGLCHGIWEQLRWGDKKSRAGWSFPRRWTFELLPTAMTGWPWCSAWWFGCHFWHFPIYWECHHPNWRTHIFQWGGPTTNQSSSCLSDVKKLRKTYREVSWLPISKGSWTARGCFVEPPFRLRVLKGPTPWGWSSKMFGARAGMVFPLDDVPQKGTMNCYPLLSLITATMSLGYCIWIHDV